MNPSTHLRIFPWVTLFIGIVGLALRCWLFSLVDRQGLLPSNHIAEILCFLLLAVTLGLCLPAMKRLDTASRAPSSRLANAGNFAGALVIILSGCLPATKELFPLLVCAFSIILGIALLFAAFFRFKGKRPSPLVHYACMTFMLLRILLSCRGWSGETQVQRFIFELFATLFFLLALYYRAQLDISGTGRKQFLLFSQAALYCSCLCLANTDVLFSLGASLWLAAESFGLPAASQGE